KQKPDRGRRARFLFARRSTLRRTNRRRHPHLGRPAAQVTDVVRRWSDTRRAAAFFDRPPASAATPSGGGGMIRLMPRTPRGTWLLAGAVWLTGCAALWWVLPYRPRAAWPTEEPAVVHGLIPGTVVVLTSMPWSSTIDGPQ